MIPEADFNKIKTKFFITKNFGFLGAILCSTDVCFKKDLQTANTDGKIINWGIDFYNSLTENDKFFVLAHELYHIAFLHPIRLGNRDPEIFNIAGDFAINNILIYGGSVLKFDNIKPLHDRKYIGWTTEQIYDDLIQNSQQIPNLSKNILGNDLKYTDPNDSTSKTEIISKIESVKSYMNESIPEIEELLNKFTKPKLHWRYILQNYLSALIEPKRSFRRQNRRYNELILPTYSKEEGLLDLSFYMDTSASISKAELIIFNTELKSIKDTLKPKNLNIIQFDTRITNRVSIDEFIEYKQLNIIGRGGTCLIPVIDDINKTKPICSVILSDLEVGYIPPCNHNIIWLRIGKSGLIPNYGTTINIESKNYE
jgi:predicted metal-dependent peptidase